MFSRINSFRFLAALIAAFLIMTGLQSAASAATKRTVSISASPAAGAAGTSVTFSGKLSKSPKGSTISIQRKSGSRWVTVKTTKTVNSAGNYAVKVVRPKSLGNYSYRASVSKKGNLRATTSKSVTVAALIRTFSSLTAKDAKGTPISTTTVGTSLTLSGTVVPFVRGTRVTLQRKVGSGWSNVATTTVAANSTFSKSGIVPTTSTVYRAVVSRTTRNAPSISNQRSITALPVIETSRLTPGNRLTGYAPLKLKAKYNPAGTWTATPLPQGLSLNASTGVISGTPTLAAVTTNVKIGFTQAGGLKAAAKTLTLVINDASKPTISTTSLPNGTVGAPYKNANNSAVNLTAVGNPVGTWTASPLPEGLSLDAATGVISGTPTKAESQQVVIGFTQTNTSLKATPKTISLTVSNGAAPVIATNSLPTGFKGTPYTATLTAVGNPAGTWTADDLPAGLTLNASTGVISGTPSVLAVTKNVTIGFTATGNPNPATPKVITLLIDPGANPVITTTNLPEGTRLSSYTTTLAAAGDPAGTWSASELPAGLSLNTSTGVISGTPTVVETKQVEIGFTQTSNGLAAAPKTLTLKINQAAAPAITTVVLPDATRFAAYETTLTATNNPVAAPGGTWTATPLPAGLTLNASTGVISGTPTATGDTSVVIGYTQTSTGVAAAPKTLVLRVNQAPAPVISTPSLPVATRFNAYSVQLTVEGNVAGTWSASNLPTGLSLNASTGVISGTPTVVETKQVEIGFTQTSTGLDATPKTLELKVNQAAPPVITTAGLPVGIRYQAYTTTLAVAGSPTGTWSSTALPAGLTLNATTGVLSGTPRNAGTTNITFTFTQTNSGLAGTKQLTLQVDQSVPIILTPSKLPDGTPLLGYDIQLQVAPAPVGKWTIVSGSLPIGITLKQDGQISGAAPLPGNSTVRIRFTETSTNLFSERTFTLKIS